MDIRRITRYFIQSYDRSEERKKIPYGEVEDALIIKTAKKFNLKIDVIDDIVNMRLGKENVIYDYKMPIVQGVL